MLGKWLAEQPLGAPLFATVTAASALLSLCIAVELVSVRDAHLFQLQNLRWGHAKDLQCSNALLVEILAAGQWRLCASLQYLGAEALESDAAVQAPRMSAASCDCPGVCVAGAPCRT